MKPVPKGHASIVKYVLERTVFARIKGSPLLEVTDLGGRHKKLVVGIGENATGKSVLRSLVQGWCESRKIKVYGTWMSKRAVGHSSMEYGHEAIDSTGVISARYFQKVLESSKDRTEPHILFLDEPDLGLSDGASMGMAEALRAFLEVPSENLVAVFVMSHSRWFLRELAPLDPRVLAFGGRSAGHAAFGSLQAWLDRAPKSISLKSVISLGHARFRKIQAFIQATKKEEEARAKAIEKAKKAKKKGSRT